MQIIPVPATVPVLPHPSPVEVWQTLLTHLFERHYGLALNETPFHDEKAIEQHIDAGIALTDAINFLVEKYELVRIDRNGFNGQEQTPYINAIDILRARRTCGLMSQVKQPSPAVYTIVERLCHEAGSDY